MMTNQAPTPNFLTANDIIDRACAAVGLVRTHRATDPPGSREIFGTYRLNQTLIYNLAGVGLHRDKRIKNDLVIRSFGTPREEWCFSRTEAKRRIDTRVVIGVDFRISRRHRGVVFTPYANSVEYGGPTAESESRKLMFTGLVHNDARLPQLARNLAFAGDDPIIVGWTALGLGGLRSIYNVFEDFHGGITPAIARWGHDPPAWKAGETSNIAELLPKEFRTGALSNLYVTEPAQHPLMRSWAQALESYRNNLHPPR